jgi:YfiH family protein
MSGGAMPFRTIADVRCFMFDAFARHVEVTNVVTSRHRGVSPPPYHSLNLGVSTGDDRLNVDANRARLAPLTSSEPDALVLCGQVHSNHVAVVGFGDAGRRFDATDAVVTNVPDLPLVILVADCVPVSLYDPIKRVIGLAHAGWRGTVAGVAARTVERMMNEFDTDPTDLVAGIGPSIGPCCYEVGPEVADEFHARQPLVANHVLLAGEVASAGEFDASVNEDRYRLDLWRANTLQLVTAGVFEANIGVAGICTACNTADFFSHRAEGGCTGRGGALMMLHERTKRSY